MRFSLTSLIRLILILAMGSSAAAVGLSRLVPTRLGWRMTSKNNQVNIPLHLVHSDLHATQWLDTSAGTLSSLDLPTGESISFASCSPWQDEGGRRQVIGLWSRFEDKSGTMTDFGIARFSFPDGEKLDVVSSDILPVSKPCWYPGMGARVLFSAGDGQLYHYAFETSPLFAGSERRLPDTQPIPIRWRCEKPGEDIFIAEPQFIADPRLSRVLLVTLRYRGSNEQPTRFGPMQIWWLRLDEGGREIVDAGRLLDPALSAQWADVRCPSTGRDASGELFLAYHRKVSREPWGVQVATLPIDTKSGTPLTVTAKGRLLASRCQPMPAVFSEDGRWVGIVELVDDKHATVKRVPLDNPSRLLSFARDSFGTAR